ncbi:sce7726 family protein [Paenibacillus albidus]|nr:sce7726 family protein [Paenibacillus albidus]
MSNNTILSRVFTQNTFKDLINGRPNEIYSTCIERYVNNTVDLENKFVIDEIYKYLTTEYRNEYFYKNTLLSKLLLGRHSVKTTVALTEVPINMSKADFVLINGKAVVYEIKTELDSFDRLENQINDYYTAFNNVCVVTCESNYNKINSLLMNTNVGIYILTNKNTISARKEPIADNSRLNHKSIFGTLRKQEFERIIIKHFGALPQTSQIKYYKECFKWFETIEILTAYKYTLIELKSRKLKEVDEFNKVPAQLKFLVYFSNFKGKEYSKLNAFLETKIRG